MKHFFAAIGLTWLLGCSLLSHAQTRLPAAPPDNLRGEELKTWLRQNWYDGKRVVLDYGTARGKMYNYVDNFNNTVTCVYSGYKESVRTDSSNTNTDVVNQIDCEHTVPQSWFNQVTRMRSDIHHLFPTYKPCNNARGSDPFGEIPDEQTLRWFRNTESLSTIPSTNIAEYSEDTNTKFEPREDHKGNLARAVFYFYTMHAGQAFTPGTGVIGAVGNIQTLYQWHLQDPVDKHELERNRRAAKAQGNFNPYIVYPDLVAKAWNLANTPTVAFSAGTGSIAEGNSGSTTYTTNVTISPAPTGTVTAEIGLVVGNSTATANTDFSFSTQTLTFSPTVTTLPVTVTVLGDATAEANETVQLVVRNVSTGVEVGSPAFHTLTITNDDGALPTVDFLAASGSLNEGDTGNVVYTTELVLSGASPSGEVLVPVFVVAAGTTANEQDYVLEQAVFTFTTAPVPQRQTVSITVRGDQLPEGNETIQLRLGTPSGGAVLGSITNHVVTIINDDQPVAGAPCSNLYFSQYTESSGGNTKAYEIYNPTDNAISLSGYRVVLYPYGANGPAEIKTLDLTGSVAAHDVVVVANGGSDASVLAQADDKTSPTTFFNGNDALALFSGTDTLDVIGRPGQDPGAGGWAVTGGTTTDNTLVRLATVSGGTPRWGAAAAATWQAVGVNVFTGFGEHTATACTVTGTRSAAQTQGVSLYPNPATGSLRVQLTGLPSVQPGVLTLFNSLGQAVRVVRQPVGASAPLVLDVANLPAGLYTVRISTPAGQFAGRVVVRH